MSVINMERRLRELERRMSRLVQVGTVVDVDYPARRVRVTIGERDSAWLRFATQRAGADRTWWPPVVGEQVMVFAPNGDAVSAVVGDSLYQDESAAPASSGSICRTIMGDGAMITYDRDANRLSVDLPGDAEIDIRGDATINVTGSAKLNAHTIALNGGTGCITQESVCHFTGRPHGDGSTTVTAGK